MIALVTFVALFTVLTILAIIDGDGFSAYESNGLPYFLVPFFHGLDTFYIATRLPLVDDFLEANHLGVQVLHILGKFGNFLGKLFHLALERGVVILFRATGQGQSQRKGDETF